PFLNKGDYEVARWAMERELGQNTFTDLLSIDGVNQKLQLSYKNAHTLHQKINRELPDVAPWSRTVIRISGINDEFKLFMRDPVECIKELWANPGCLDHLTYAPEHRF
ncbi:hypothetical protein M405DRAFT_693986, partial [Rhizopogon salebrosus TDB-379]